MSGIATEFPTPLETIFKSVPKTIALKDLVGCVLSFVYIETLSTCPSAVTAPFLPLM